MRWFREALVVAGCLAAAACAATKPADAQDIRFSGFLSTYNGLTATNDPEKAVFRWVKPGLDLNGYTQILIDRPEARMSPEALSSIGDEDMAYLLGALDKTFRDTLSSHWLMADAPGPRVLRLRVCLTDADSSTAVLTPFSRILPLGFVISKGKQLATGTAINVGKVGIEMEALDGESGERLFAAVDRRVGTGVAREMFTYWGDVQQAFTLWAERTAERLPEYGMPNRTMR
jgi:hypothetical protein